MAQSEVTVEVGVEPILNPDGRIIALWVLVDGDREDCLWVDDEFPYVPTGAQN